MKALKLLSLLISFVIFFISCEKVKMNDDNEFDRNAMEEIIVSVEGTKAMSSAIISFPSGETHKFLRARIRNSSEESIEKGLGNKFLGLSTDIIPHAYRNDTLFFNIGYDESEGDAVAGSVIKPKYIDIFWLFSNDIRDTAESFKGSIKVVEMTKEELVLHFDNVTFTLADGDYSINGFVSLSR